MDQNIELSLKEVQIHFETWRRNKDRQGYKIPKSLWDEVYLLSKHHSPSDISRFLHLSGGQVKELLAKRKDIKKSSVAKKEETIASTEVSIELVEVSSACCVNSNQDSSAVKESKIVCGITKQDGSRFQIEIPQNLYSEIPSLFHTFLKG